MEDEKERGAFRDKLGGYVKVYAFLSQIMPYYDQDLEKLYSFGRMLLPHLPLDRNTDIVKLDDEVGLQYYRLQRISTGAIELKEGDSQSVKSPTEVETGKAKDEKAPLSEIIDLLNEKLGTNFAEEDRLFFEQIKEKATSHPKVIQLRKANPFDKFQLGLRSMLEDLMIQ